MSSAVQWVLRERALIAAVCVALAACGAPPRETAPPPAVTETVQPAPQPAPPPPAAWELSLDTYGGFVNRGKGRVALRSDDPAARDACQAVTVAREAVAQAVLAARPENWVGCYQRATFSGMSDQISYRLLYRVEDENGKSTRYEVSWQDDSVGMRPADLSRLADAAWDVRKRMESGCKP